MLRRTKMKIRFAETVANAKMAKISVLMIPSIPGWTFFSQTLSLKQETFAIGTGPILISLILFDKRTLSSVQNIRLHLNLLFVPPAQEHSDEGWKTVKLQVKHNVQIYE